MYLVITRKESEKVFVGSVGTVMVVEVRGDKVRLGFDVHRSIPVNREEIVRYIEGGGGKVSCPVERLIAAARVALRAVGTIRLNGTAELDDARGVVMELAKALVPFNEGIAA